MIIKASTETHARLRKLFAAFLLVAFIPGALSSSAVSEELVADTTIAADDGIDELRVYDKRWFVLVGAANYHARLEESEQEIDDNINGLFGKILPRWQEPETFKDWSDDWKLWSLWAGFGRDLSPKWLWAVSAGGGEGTVKNSNTYRPFLIPAKIDVDFTRLEVYLEGTLTWYPWGKPALSENPDGDHSGRLRRAMRGTRPFFDLAAGYDYQEAEADVRVKLPLVGTAFREHQKDDFHLLYANPRIGVEIPIDDKNSVGLSAGYVFFHEHGDEFDAAVFNLFLRHKF